METETLSSRNIVDLIFRKRFGTDICGKAVQTGETGAIVGADGEQIVLQEPQPTPEPQMADENFVLGWDCL